MGYVTWDRMGTARRVWEAAGAALVWGVVCGLLLGASAGLYLAGTVVAVLGAIVGGSQHDDLRGALLRGLAGGTLFGLGVLLGFAVSGADEPAVELPDPRVLLLLFTILPSPPLNAVGWLIGRRVRGTARAPTRP